MESYLLLLHSKNERPNLSPEEMQAITARYKAWGQKLGAQGRLAGGEKLADEAGRHMIGNGSSLRISDGPFIETKDVIGGYFVLKAESYDEAVQLCRDCPHLEYGNGIEIRRIEVV